jgi:hypothetical protein
MDFDNLYLYNNDDEKFFWYKNPGGSFFSNLATDFFDGDGNVHDGNGDTDGGHIVTLDCRKIKNSLYLTVHDDACDTRDDSCKSNLFLWAHSTEGTKINNIVFQGSDDFIIMTRYDVQ